MIDIAAIFGEDLARARNCQDMSQEELDFLGSVHHTEVSALEGGLRLARIDTLVKLRGSLGISAEELLAGLD